MSIKKYFHEWSDEKSQLIMILSKILTNSISLLVTLITLLYIINKKTKNNIIFLKTYNEKIIFILILSCFLRAIFSIYYPSTFNLCINTKFVLKLTEQFGILSFFLLCYLILQGIKKNSNFKLFPYFSIFAYLGLIILNVLIYTEVYVKKKEVKFDPILLVCSLRYARSPELHLILSLIPLLLIEIIAIYTYIKSKDYLKKHPEKNTLLILEQIKWYPIVMVIIYSPKCLRQGLICLDFDIPIWVSAIEQFFMGVLGIIVCFLFFWKREDMGSIDYRRRKEVEFKVPVDEEMNRVFFYG